MMAQTNTGWEQMHYKCSNFSFTSELMAACPYPNMYEGMFDFLYGNFLKKKLYTSLKAEWHNIQRRPRSDCKSV